MKKSNDTVGNRTHDLTACSAVHAYLVPRLKKEKSYTFTPSWAFISHSRVNCTFNPCSMAQEREFQRMKISVLNYEMGHAG